MKKTQNIAQNKGLKSGLSMILTLVLLLQAGKPMIAKAETTADLAVVASTDQTGAQADLSANAPTEDQATVQPKPEIVQDVLMEVCTKRGYGEECAKHLLGMLWKESNNVSTAVGDHGLARGYFQIHYKLHGITTDCAEDLRCSANWTISYLESNHYPKYVSYAVQCHNSCNLNNGYAASALRFGRVLWNQPLTVVTAKEIRDQKALALKN